MSRYKLYIYVLTKCFTCAFLGC